MRNFFAFLLVGIASALTCPPETYLSGENCKVCDPNCILCHETYPICLVCNLHFFEKEGKCFRECDVPLFPFVTNKNDIRCKTIPYFKENFIYQLLDHYSSSSEIFSAYVNVMTTEDYLELSFWIKFDTIANTDEEQNFIAMTNFQSPYPDYINKPTFLKYGIRNSKLVGPTQVTDFEFDIEENTWHFVSVFLELPTANKLFTKVGMLFIKLDVHEQEKISDFVTYGSMARLGKDFSVHIGNLNGKLNFEIRSLRIILTKQQIFIGECLLLSNFNSFYKDPSINFTKMSNSQEISHKIDMDFIKEGNCYMIKYKIQLKQNMFPMIFAKIESDGGIILEVSLKRINQYLWIAVNDVPISIIKLVEFSLNFYFFATEKEILLIFQNFRTSINYKSHSYFYVAPFLQDHSASAFELIISLYPSFFFRDDFSYESLSDQTQNCNSLLCQNFLENFFQNTRVCPKNSKNLFYIFSLEECDEDFDTTCFDKIRNCKHCLSPNHCAICQTGFLFYEGRCIEKCENESYEMKFYNNKFCRYCPAYKNYFTTNWCNSCDDFHNSNISKDVQNIINLNCAVNTEKFLWFNCPNECISCYRNRTFTYCTKCKENYFEYKGNCYSECPENTYIYFPSKKCLDSCNLENHIKSLRICQPCKLIDGIIQIIDCSNVCDKGFISEEPCRNYSAETNCIVRGREYCEFDETYRKDLKYSGLILAAKSLYQDATDQVENIKALNFLLFHPLNIATICTRKICEHSKNINIDCCIKENRTQINEEFEMYHPIKFDDSLCLVPFDEFYTIQFNGSCIFVPNSHLYIKNDYKIIDNRKAILNFNYSQVKNNFINLENIQLCENLHSNHKQKCLVDCPITHYKTQNSTCIRCPTNCFRCKLIDNLLSCLDMSLTSFDIFHRKKILKRALNFPVSILDDNAEFVFALHEECPPGCSKCYDYGSDYACTECVSPDMKISKIDSLCHCILPLKFDIKSNSCVAVCDNDTFLSQNSCLESCNMIIDKQIDNYIHLGNRCKRSCPSLFYSTANWAISDNIGCGGIFKGNDYDNCFDGKIDMENFVEEEWKKGLINFAHIYSASCFQKIMDILTTSYEPRNAREQALIISFLSSQKKFLLKEFTIHQSFEVLIRLLENSYDTQNIFKIVYSLMNTHQKGIQFLRKSEDSEIDFLSDLNSFSRLNLVETDDFEIELFLQKIPKETVLQKIYFIKENFLILGLHLQSNLAIRHNKSICANLSLKSKSTSPKFIHRILVNLTTKVANPLQENHEIRLDSYYFVLLSKFEVKGDINPMIDDDLFFGLQSETSPPEKEIKSNQREISKTIEILVYICGTILILVMFIWFLRRKIFDESKIKFVQMVEMEDDEENNEEDVSNNFE